MLVVLNPQTPEAVVADVAARLRMAGLAVHRTEHDGRVRFAALGEAGAIDWKQVEGWPGVESVSRLARPFKLASRAFHPQDTVISVGRIAIGGPQLAIMAGPCSIESEEQIFAVAKAVAAAGATVLRGGAFKPRTSPYAFQGLGEEGLKLMRRAADAHGLAVVSEVMEPQMVPLLARYSDILQIGARNMQNYSLLKTVGKIGKPVLLKRGMAATIQDLLLSAEYILSEGNPHVILCERGLRSFDSTSRNLFDLTAIPVVHQLSHLPIVADPSHGTGRRDKVPPMARAAVAAGCDGLIIEVHPQPDQAKSDGAQSLNPEQFGECMKQLHRVAVAVDRKIAVAPSEAG